MKDINVTKKTSHSSERMSLAKLCLVGSIFGFISVAFSLVFSILAFFIFEGYVAVIISFFMYISSLISLAMAIITIVIGAKAEKVGDINNYKWKGMRATFLTLGIVHICFPIVSIFFPFSNFVSLGLELAISIISVLYMRALKK